jgi:hypothetical protein
MDDLRTELDQLKDSRLDYVIARSKARTDAEGYREAGIAKASFYSWPEEERTRLNDLAQQVKRASALRAMMILQDATEEAARVKVEGLKSRKENIKQDAASEILDRMIGKPLQRQEVSGKSGGPIIVVNWDDASEYTD